MTKNMCSWATTGGAGDPEGPATPATCSEPVREASSEGAGSCVLGALRWPQGTRYSQGFQKIWHSCLEAVLGPRGQGARVLVSACPLDAAPLDSAPAAQKKDSCSLTVFTGLGQGWGHTGTQGTARTPCLGVCSGAVGAVVTSGPDAGMEWSVEKVLEQVSWEAAQHRDEVWMAAVAGPPGASQIKFPHLQGEDDKNTHLKLTIGSQWKQRHQKLF